MTQGALAGESGSESKGLSPRKASSRKVLVWAMGPSLLGSVGTVHDKP